MQIKKQVKEPWEWSLICSTIKLNALLTKFYITGEARCSFASRYRLTPPLPLRPCR